MNLMWKTGEFAVIFGLVLSTPQTKIEVQQKTGRIFNEFYFFYFEMLQKEQIFWRLNRLYSLY